MMSSDRRLAVALFGAFVLWLPTLGAMAAGDLEPSSAGLRYAAAVGLVWVAVRVVESVVQGYAHPPGDDEGADVVDDVNGAPAPPTARSGPTPAAATPEAERARRRGDDHVVEAGAEVDAGVR